MSGPHNLLAQSHAPLGIFCEQRAISFWHLAFLPKVVRVRRGAAATWPALARLLLRVGVGIERACDNLRHIVTSHCDNLRHHADSVPSAFFFYIKHLRCWHLVCFVVSALAASGSNRTARAS